MNREEIEQKIRDYELWEPMMEQNKISKQRQLDYYRSELEKLDEADDNAEALEEATRAYLDLKDEFNDVMAALNNVEDSLNIIAYGSYESFAIEHAFKGLSEIRSVTEGKRAKSSGKRTR